MIETQKLFYKQGFNNKIFVGKTSMEIDEFNKKINEICIARGLKLSLEFDGIWNVIVLDKRTEKKIAETGSVGLSGILTVLTIPFTDTEIWST